MRRAAAVLLFAACAVHVRAGAQTDPVFDGVWDGQLDVAAIYGVADAKAFMPKTQRRVQIRLRGKAVTLRLDGDYIRPRDEFDIDKHDAAASIHSESATLDWIETWQISLTKTGADTMLGFVWRVVNNKGWLPGADMSKFAWGGVIELERGPVAAIAPRFGLRESPLRREPRLG